MSDISIFESRKGSVHYKPEAVYAFVTDIRNFERFIPENTVTEMVSDRDSCSFRVNMLGKVNISILEKTEYSRVSFRGDLLQTNTFIFNLFLEPLSAELTGIRILVEADLNPMLKMMAAEPVKRLLETLVSGMEKFEGWEDTKS